MPLLSRQTACGIIFRFGPFEADSDRFELRRRGQAVQVQRRVLETILYLAESGGRLVTPNDLIRGPWQGTVVSEAALKQAIMLARRALDDPERGQPYIQTVRGKGFRWDGAAENALGRHAPPPPTSKEQQSASHTLRSTGRTSKTTENGQAVAQQRLAGAQRMLSLRCAI